MSVYNLQQEGGHWEESLCLFRSQITPQLHLNIYVCSKIQRRNKAGYRVNLRYLDAKTIKEGIIALILTANEG